MKAQKNLLNNFTELSAFLSTYDVSDEKEEFERLSFLQFLEAFGGFAYVRARSKRGAAVHAVKCRSQSYRRMEYAEDGGIV